MLSKKASVLAHGLALEVGKDWVLSQRSILMKSEDPIEVAIIDANAKGKQEIKCN